MSFSAMLEPENLARLAELSRQADLETAKMRTAQSIGTSVEISEDGKFVIPIEVDTGVLNHNLSATAKLKLKLNLDIESFMEARKIQDRDERIKKIRELIHLEAPVFELSFK